MCRLGCDCCETTLISFIVLYEDHKKLQNYLYYHGVCCIRKECTWLWPFNVMKHVFQGFNRIERVNKHTNVWIQGWCSSSVQMIIQFNFIEIQTVKALCLVKQQNDLLEIQTIFYALDSTDLTKRLYRGLASNHTLLKYLKILNSIK